MNLDETFETAEEFETDFGQIDVYKKKLKKYKAKFNELSKVNLDTLPEDFAEVKANYEYLLSLGRQLLEKAINEVAMNPTPRNLESYALLMKQFSETNEKIIDLYEKIKKITDNTNTSNVNIQNQQINVFQGNLQDILEKLEEKNVVEGEVVEDD